MKILIICHKLPYPPKEGGSMAMNMVIEGLINEGHDVKVFALETNKFKLSKDIPKEYKQKTKLETLYVNIGFDPLLAIRSFASNTSYHIRHFHKEEIFNRIEKVLNAETYDIIHFESIFLMSFLDRIKKLSKAKIVVRTHNVEHQIWSEIADSSSNILKRSYLKQVSNSLQKSEVEILNKADQIISISSEDTKKLKQLGVKTLIETIGFGIDVNAETDVSFSNLSIGFIGALNWIPNDEALKWFLESVWPKLSNKFPDLIIEIAGRECPKWLKNYRVQNLNVIGEVESSKDFILKHPIFIAPIKSGSGIKIKVLEALALGRLVICSSKAIEGIPAIHKKHLIIANTVSEYIDAIQFIIENPEKIQAITKNAQDLISQHFNPLKLSKKLSEIFHHLISE